MDTESDKSCSPVWREFLDSLNYSTIFNKTNENLLLINFAVLHPHFFENININNLINFINSFNKTIIDKIPNLSKINLNPEIPNDNLAPIIFNRNCFKQSGFKRVLITRDKYIPVTSKYFFEIIELKPDLIEEPELFYNFFKGIDAINIRNNMIKKRMFRELCLLDENFCVNNFWKALDAFDYHLLKKAIFSKIILERFKNNEYLIDQYDDEYLKIYRYILPFFNDYIIEKNSKDFIFAAPSFSRECYVKFERNKNSKNFNKNYFFKSLKSCDLPYIHLMKDVDFTSSLFKRIGNHNRKILKFISRNNPELIKSFASEEFLRVLI